jgi:hypothetical protein
VLNKIALIVLIALCVESVATADRHNCTVLLLLFFSISVANAVETVTLGVKQLAMQGWQLQHVKISLMTAAKKSSQLQLSIAHLSLPKPFADLKLLNIHCSEFSWGNNEIHCLQGKTQLQSKLFNSPQFNFSFHITPKQSQFHIQQLKLLDGEFVLQGLAQQNNWQLSLNGNKIGLSVLHQLLFPQLKLSSGQFNITANAHGNQHGLSRFKTQVQTHKLSIQTADGSKASENVNVNLNLNAIKANQVWLWESNNIFQQGNLYFEPLYLENKNTPISLQGHGYWNALTQQIEVNFARFNHPELGFITANGSISQRPKLAIDQANLYLNIPNLAAASAIYLTPFISGGTLEGLSLAGKLEGGLSLKKQAITDAYLISHNLAVSDKKQRFDLQGGIMALNWSNQASFTKNSLFSWQKLNLSAIPIGPGYFSLLLKQQQISLLTETKLPLLNGYLVISQFDWQRVNNHNPKVHFAGQLKHLSLQQLTQALNWTPLPGNISGQIPSINLVDGKLSLDGGLKIKAFSGDIFINKLAISGFMTDFTQFYTDIQIDNLDMDQLTERFSFGKIQGRVSGYVNNLYLENWQPIGFDAWLATPENDRSTHKISQKAVENLASIGGGGAVDLLSRTVLSIFDDFDYDKLGLGCYLNKGVCQLRGVAEADYGYYIVKGGGLPRIDVLGYNPRIDWGVLRERLKRISESEPAVVD